MAISEVEQQKLIIRVHKYKEEHPHLKAVSDEVVLSVMLQDKNLPEDTKKQLKQLSLQNMLSGNNLTSEDEVSFTTKNSQLKR